MIDGKSTSHLASALRQAAGASVRADLRTSARAAAHVAMLRWEDVWSASSHVTNAPIDVIDMFSGCGGMSAGFRAANGLVPAFRLAAAVDIDTVANATYASNLNVVPLREDISRLARQTGPLEVLPSRRKSRPLVLIGCAPCQGFSSHRNSAGQQDQRNSLFFDFARIAARLRPDAIVVENVPELLTDRYWPIVEAAKKTLEKAGYFVHLAVHNMAEFGVPQERFRALLLAMPRPFTSPRGFLTRPNFTTVRQAIGKLPPVAAGQRHAHDPMHYTAGHRESTLETIRAVPKDGGSRPENVGPPCLRRAKARNGRAVYEDVYGRLAWDKSSITITAYARNPASGRYIHPTQDRGLSVREAALLQSFPKDYMFQGTLDERFRQIGNAVPPMFAASLALHVIGEMLSKEAPGAFEPGIQLPVGPSFSRLIPSLKAGHRSGDSLGRAKP